MDDEKMDDIIKDSRDDIRREEKQKRLRRYDKKTGFLGRGEKRRRREPGEGIRITEDEDELVLNCRHPYRNGLGHEADCKHTVCIDCLERYNLVCAEPGCFRAFCTAEKCRNKPHMYAGLPFCLKHKLLFMNMILSCNLLSKKKAERILQNYKREYESKKSKVRSRMQKDYKEKSDEGKDVSGRSNRT